MFGLRIKAQHTWMGCYETVKFKSHVLKWVYEYLTALTVKRLPEVESLVIQQGVYCMHTRTHVCVCVCDSL